MLASEIQELLKADVEGGAIVVKSAEGFDLRFGLRKQLLMLKDGVVYENDRKGLEIGFSIKRIGGSAVERITFPYDGVGVVSSIRSNPLFAELVRETNYPKRFFESVAGLLKGLDRCQCQDAAITHRRLVGIDLSYPEVTRQRGGLLAVQCAECQYWALQPFYADTQRLKGVGELHAYITSTFSSTDIQIPPLSSIADEPTSSYKIYTPYTSQRQIEENRKKILELKKDLPN